MSRNKVYWCAISHKMKYPTYFHNSLENVKIYKTANKIKYYFMSNLEGGGGGGTNPLSGFILVLRNIVYYNCRLVQ